MALDKFYTKNEVAKECIELIPEIDTYDLIIEPSAGNGSFSSQLNCIAYDIEPEDENIIKEDWFNVKPFTQKHILIVGNPPFGPRSVLAKNFIKHARKVGAETIAFILPDTFSKLSNQSKTLFPDNWRLIIEHKLSDCNFTTEDGKDYFVPCSFYVWTSREGTLNLRQVKEKTTDDFIFLPRGDLNADFVVNGNSGKIKNVEDVTNSKAEHYIKAKSIDSDKLRLIFSQLDYNKFSSVNGGNFWIGQQEILKAYNSWKSNN